MRQRSSQGGNIVLLLDLADVAPRDRVDAFHHAMTNESVPNDIAHEEPETGIRAHMELWRVGGLDCFATHNSGFELRRTQRHVHDQRSRPVVSVSLQTAGVGRADTAGTQRLLGPDDLCVFHELTPRVYGWSGDGASRAVVLDVDRLGLSVETVHRASLHLRASPLHDLVLRHVEGLLRDPGRIEGDPGATALAGATTELIRALLLSAVHDECTSQVRSAMADTLVTRIMAYAGRHLTEPDLTAGRIATAHAVSERHLYAVLSGAGIQLEQWIITERLTRAREMLASDSFRHLPIGAVAAQCGFINASHFARRFRAKYGVTPRDWRNRP
ncbi:AraC family transcriptional regulator [Streptomyces sp. NPDC091271]|uniref:AraC family transcriptional regulator n=1 Tax=Streptomyces sp. NPDC091271 TaxID=3365980 RepID=UPI0037F76942